MQTLQRRRKRGRTDPSLLSPVAELWSCGVRQMKMPPTTAAVDLRAGNQLARELGSSVGTSLRDLKHGTLGADWTLLEMAAGEGRQEEALPSEECWGPHS